MPSSKTKDVKLFNLDTFLPDVNAARADGRINSPRSLVVVQRMGYEANDLLPIPKKALFTKHHDNEDSLQMKFDDFTMKRLKKIEECRAEYGICKEFCKYATLDQYARQPIKMHWIPPSGDPSGKKARKALSDKEKTKMMAATSGPDPTAIKIMAEAAANQASQMMDIEMKKMEAIKRRQKREIDRVVANEGKMAVLQAKILKAELDELDRKRDHDKVVMLNRKAAITKKQQFDVEKKSELDQEIIERNKIAAREMLVERKLAEKEKKLEVVRRREAREKEIYRASLMVERAKKTQNIFDDLEDQAQKTRERIEERHARIKAAFEEKKRKKELEIVESRNMAEKRIAKAKAIADKIQADKKVNYDAKVVSHKLMKTQRLEERSDEIEAQAKALRDKHSRQKDAYAVAKEGWAEFRAATLRHAIERDGYYEEVQKVVRRDNLKRNTKSLIRKNEVLENVRRINHIHESVRNQREVASEADDDRTDMIRQAKQKLIEERKSIAHDANMRKYRVNEAMEKMKIANNFNNLERELDKAINGDKRNKKLDDDMPESPDDEKS